LSCWHLCQAWLTLHWPPPKGPLPASLGNLTSLKNFSAEKNKLTGMWTSPQMSSSNAYGLGRWNPSIVWEFGEPPEMLYARK
jgi:hypothetical protein